MLRHFNIDDFYIRILFQQLQAQTTFYNLNLMRVSKNFGLPRVRISEWLEISKAQ